MTGEERLNEFMEAVENWTSSKSLPKIQENETISMILNMKSLSLDKLTREECLSCAYELYAHAEYIHSVKSKEEVILDWAESSLWFIISSSMNQYGDKYTKWQEKFFSAVKENPLATDILKIKNHAEARIKIINGKADRVQSMADILINLSKRR